MGGIKIIKKKNYLKASILLAITLFILLFLAESAQAVLSIGSITGGLGVETTISTTDTITRDVQWKITITISNVGCIITRGVCAGTSIMDSSTSPVTIRFRFPIGFRIFPLIWSTPMTVTVTANDGVTSATRTTPPGPTHIFLFFTW